MSKGNKYTGRGWRRPVALLAIAGLLSLLVVALVVAAIWAWPKLFGGNEAEVTDSIADTLAVVEDTLAVESTPDTSQLMIMNNL